MVIIKKCSCRKLIFIVNIEEFCNRQKPKECLLQDKSWPATKSTPPDPAGVIFWPRNYGIAFIIKGAAKYFIGMPFQDLQTVTRLYLPQPCGLIATRGQNFRSLRIKCYLRNFSFVANQNCLACTCLGVIHTRGAIGGSGNKLKAMQQCGAVIMTL